MCLPPAEARVPIFHLKFEARALDILAIYQFDDIYVSVFVSLCHYLQFWQNKVDITWIAVTLAWHRNISVIVGALQRIINESSDL